MRNIDADELVEVLYRSDCSTREKIETIIRQQPTIDSNETIKKAIVQFEKLSNQHANASDYHRGKSHAYAIAVDILRTMIREDKLK